MPEVLTVAERATDRQTNLDWLIGYLFIFIVSSALLQMTENISYLGLHCEKLDQLWVPN